MLWRRWHDRPRAIKSRLESRWNTIESNISLGWFVMVRLCDKDNVNVKMVGQTQIRTRAIGRGPTKGSTMFKRCMDILCSSGVSLYWQPPILEGSAPRSLRRTLKAKNGSVLSYDWTLVSMECKVFLGRPFGPGGTDHFPLVREAIVAIVAWKRS